jgi:hypothetical protein
MPEPHARHPLGPGARTGVGTYLNYLIAASVLTASALAGALAYARRRTPDATRGEAAPPRPAREETER